ncbi:putative glycerol-1-phosphate prenyltransferase [Croceifilum oryzae]|uniref:Heptaprenylglyceryl phosphate synthase n=1 Tax=Croceifilum oryzae TaxID=1553429 RepID=A0AAJ1TFK6_9BACL|nr:heptaprenylglyceryl phosphate synthase [Croceifilum oryzae]MDQ0416122.1 putative glycerol-1-phosphate prenyltransferase [Croceifilum oryzae]
MLVERMQTWRHVFKLDPNRPIEEGMIIRLLQSGTDAIIVGGTDGITYQNTHDLMRRVKQTSLPCVQEISNAKAVVPGFDGFCIPVVLNTNDTEWLIGAHQKTMKEFGEWIPWNQVAVEGYVVLNPEAKVAQLTGAQTSLTHDDILAYAQIAEHLFRLPFFYLEYSGVYGDARVVQATAQKLKNTKLIYGGGIRLENQAREMAQFADIVVVGNLIYDDIEVALQTVSWVKETKRIR